MDERLKELKELKSMELRIRQEKLKLRKEELKHQREQLFWL